MYGFNLISGICTINVEIFYLELFRCLVSHLGDELNEQSQSECLKLLGNFLSLQTVTASRLRVIENVTMNTPI